MADNLPAPESRTESYLAKAAGEDVAIPEKPLSRTEQYLAAIAQGGGGGGSYTAGTGIDITSNTISVDTTTIQPKLTAGTNITIADNVISAAGGSGPTVVQTTGSSTTDVMSQDATTSMLYSDGASKQRIAIGDYSNASKNYAIAIGNSATASGSNGVIAIGRNATASGNHSIAIGGVQVSSPYSIGIGGEVSSSLISGSVALGYKSSPNRSGEVNIGSTITTYGYNNTNYRILGGVHDPVDNHDAATKGYVDGLVGNVAAALNAINNGTQS